MRCVKDRILPVFFSAVLTANLFLGECLATEYVPVEAPEFKLPVRGERKTAKPGGAARGASNTGTVAKKTRDRSNGKTASPPASPAPAASESAAQGFPLFGTVGLRRPLNKAPAWADVLERNKANPVFKPERYFNKKTNWQMFREQAQKLDDKGKLDKVNAFFNAFPYIIDRKNWGKEDYWEIPDEFLKKSGDCEDYAIIKYLTLRELGFPAESMRIVIVRDTVLNEGHAVLAVKIGGAIYILDNQSRVVLPQERIHNYEAHYSVNELGRWNQMKPSNR